METQRWISGANRTASGLSAQDQSEAIAAGAEWDASPLRPVAHWVVMPTGLGRNRLEMVWEVPDPMPPGPSV
jgi:hypothetical protein